MRWLKRAKVVVLGAASIALAGVQSQPAGNVARGPGEPNAIGATIDDGIFQPKHVELGE